MFEHLGYYKEYYIDNKFIGRINCDKDRDEIGYGGRKKETLKQIVVFQNGRKIKAGIEVMTMIYPLCGQIKQA